MRSHDERTATLASKGIYLMFGGTETDYADLSPDGRQLIYTTFMATINMILNEVKRSNSNMMELI